MHDVDFVHGAATVIDPEAHLVHTTKGGDRYDSLVIATGYRDAFDVLPGFDTADGATRSPRWTTRARG